MAYTSVELSAIVLTLETAYLRGERQVVYDNRSVTYASGQEMLQKINYFKGLQNQQGGGRSRQTLLVASKGL